MVPSKRNARDRRDAFQKKIVKENKKFLGKNMSVSKFPKCLVLFIAEVQKAKRLNLRKGSSEAFCERSYFRFMDSYTMQILFISFLRRTKQRVGDNCDTPKIGIGGFLWKEL